MEYVYRGLRKSIYDDEPLRLTLARKLDLPDIDGLVVERESIDARRKPDIYRVYNLRFTVSRHSPRLQQLRSEGVVAAYAPKSLPASEPYLTLPERPVIVGFGPAGMFAGLHLARMGYKPTIFERGEAVGGRVKTVNRLWSEGVLDPESNMQFGEGGAGTFSDGKLTTGKESPLDRLILETLVDAGAPDSILFRHRPHVGTDHLRRVVVNLRRQIAGLGGEVHFGQKVTDVHMRDGAVEAITVSGQRVPARCLVLAIGHSARDTVEMLHASGVAMEPKPFAIGVRIEHPAEFINESQYGRRGAKVLPAADYKLTHRYNGAGIYSFCMCPGGQVVCAASEPEGLVTNGMSRHARDGSWSNSAIVVGVDPKTLGMRRPLEALDYQRGLERRAYETGGGGYVAPAQRAADFQSDEISRDIGETTYLPGVVSASLREVLPAFVVVGLLAGLRRFDRIIPGFVAKGVLIASETRTSSPIRMLRNGDCRSASTEGLYLLGEGAGYAGGIMTCARDALAFTRRVRRRA